MKIISTYPDNQTLLWIFKSIFLFLKTKKNVDLIKQFMNIFIQVGVSHARLIILIYFLKNIKQSNKKGGRNLIIKIK